MATASQSIPSQRRRPMSVRKTINFPEDLWEWLEANANARNVAPAVLVRMLISSCRDRSS